MSILDNEGHDPSGLGNAPSRAEIKQLSAALDNERANAEGLRQNCTRVVEENQKLRSALWHVREDMAQLVQQVDGVLGSITEQGARPGRIPHRDCKTPSECLNASTCLDGWHCAHGRPDDILEQSAEEK